MNKKALIITYYWPPSGGSGVQRWVKFAKYLPENGWTPVVYTPENPESPAVDENLVKDLPAELTVLKTPIREPYGLYKKMTGNRQIGVRFITEKKRRFSPEQLFKWIRGNLFIPDARKFWITPSVRYLADYLDKHPVDVLITTGPPHSMHLIGHALNRRFHIPWLADFRDPWTSIDYLQEMNLGRRAQRKHKELEKRMLTRADRVVVVSPTMKEEMESIARRPVDILTNGFDEDDFQPDRVTPDAKFTIVHTGMMSASQHASALWDLLSELTRTEPGFRDHLVIKLVGPVDLSILEEIDRAGLTPCLTRIDYVPHNEVVDHQQSARILLLVLNDTSHVRCLMPGKLFEYMASGRPVLCIGPEDSDAGNLFNLSDAYCLADRDQRENIRQYILRQYKSYRNGDSGRLNVDISDYSRKSLTQRLASILNEMTK